MMLHRGAHRSRLCGRRLSLLLGSGFDRSARRARKHFCGTSSGLETTAPLTPQSRAEPLHRGADVLRLDVPVSSSEVGDNRRHRGDVDARPRLDFTQPDCSGSVERTTSFLYMDRVSIDDDGVSLCSVRAGADVSPQRMVLDLQRASLQLPTGVAQPTFLVAEIRRLPTRRSLHLRLRHRRR